MSSKRRSSGRLRILQRLSGRQLGTMALVLAVGLGGGIGLSQASQDEDKGCVETLQRFEALRSEAIDHVNFDSDPDIYADAMLLVRNQPECFSEWLKKEAENFLTWYEDESP